MNYLDYGVIIIIGLNAIIAMSRGLVKTVFSLCSMLASIILAYLFYPFVKQILIEHTGIYNLFVEKISLALKLTQPTYDVITPQQQMMYIQNLKVGNIFKNMLVSNNNPEIYKLLGANHINEYITGMIATLAISALAFVIVLIVVNILIKVVGNILDLVSKLPIIKQANKLGGFVMGTIFGVVFVWILCIVFSFTITIQADQSLYTLLQSSTVAKFFYDNNLIWHYISNVSKILI